MRMRFGARRWWLAFALGAGALVLAYEIVLPTLVRHQARAALSRAGFPDAELEVTDASFARVALAHVTLARGLDLGDVELSTGVWQLARGSAADVTLRGPLLDARHVLAAVMGAALPDDLPVRRVRIADGALAVGTSRIAIAGAIDLAPLAFDVTARAPRLEAGPIVLRDVVARVHGTAGGARACVAGTLAGAATAELCASTRSLERVERVDLSWAARQPGAWSAYGGGHLVREAHGFALRDGTAHVALAEATLGEVQVRAATLHADLAGTSRSVALRGELRAAHVAGGAVRADAVALPFAVRARLADGALQLVSDAPLVATAASATAELLGTSVVLPTPKLTVDGRASAAGERVVLAAGAARDGRAHLDLQVHDVDLAPLLPVASRGRIRGRGRLEGNVELTVTDGELAIARGALRARGGGSLQITDAALRRRVEAAIVGPAIYERVAAALTDFEFTRLAIAIGREPDATVSLRGRGRRVRQELALDLAIRGLRGAAERFATTHPTRSR